MLQQPQQQAQQGFAPYASPLPPSSGLGASYPPQGGAQCQVPWQQPTLQAPARTISIESSRTPIHQAPRGLSVENGQLRQFSTDLAPGAPRPGQQAQPLYQQSAPFAAGHQAPRMGGPPPPNPYQSAWPPPLGGSGPFSFLPGVHNSQLLQPQAFAFDAIQEDPRTAMQPGGSSTAAPGGCQGGGAGELPQPGRGMSLGGASDLSQPSRGMSQTGASLAAVAPPPPGQASSSQPGTSQAAAPSGASMITPPVPPPQIPLQGQSQGQAQAPHQVPQMPQQPPGQMPPQQLAQPQPPPAAAPAQPAAQQPPALPAAAVHSHGGHGGPQEPDRAARRAALCEQAFQFVDANRTGYVDMSQNKTGLTVVFEQLGDVPMPKDEWYVRVFRNFVRSDKELLDYRGFVEIVVQWDEHYLKKRRQKALAQQQQQPPPPPLAETSPSEAQRAEALPPPPPRGDSVQSVRSAASASEAAAAAGGGVQMAMADIDGVGSALSAASSGADCRASAATAEAAADPGRFESSAEGGWRSAAAAPGGPGSFARGGPAGQPMAQDPSPCGGQPPPPPPLQQQQHSLGGQASAAPPRAGPVSAPEGPSAQPALLLAGREVVGESTIRHSPCAESDEVGGTARSTSAASAATRVTAADIVSEVMFPTYVGKLAIFDDYEFFGDVGSGSFGKVMVVRHKHTRQLRACKVVAVQTALQRDLIDTEIRLLKSLNHPNIMKMHEVYYEQEQSQEIVKNGNIYLVTELCEGGDLFSRILHHYERLHQPMTESHVAFMMLQILSATKYCHDRDIIHRDIKPENILFVDRSSSSPLKIIDFGLADFSEKIREQAKEVKVPRGGTVGRLAQMLPSVNGKHLIPWHERKRVMQKAGTPHYMAPEMIEGNYDLKADLFSIGIILCQLFTGWHPFYSPGDDEQAVHAKIRAPEPVQFPRDVWDPVSRDARDLCKKLLEKSPQKRYSAEQALAHPWLLDPSKPSPFGNVSSLSVSIFEGLMQYQAYNKLKRAVLQLLTRELSEFQIQELRKKFMALDAAGDGLLSPEELVIGMRHVGYEMSGAELQQIMSALDGTGRQRIGYKEFISALIERRVKFDRQQLAACFKRLDVRGTGHITFDDVKGIMSPALTESEWQEIASMGNQTGDVHQAEITFEQFVALMEQTDS